VPGSGRIWSSFGVVGRERMRVRELLHSRGRWGIVDVMDRPGLRARHAGPRTGRPPTRAAMLDGVHLAGGWRE